VLNKNKVLNFLATNQTWFTLLGRLILGGVIFTAGILKVGKPQLSAMSVRAYELLPTDIANFFGYVLPWFEVGLGLLLIIGAGVKVCAILGGATMLIFIIGISQAWARGLSIDCGCFSAGGVVDPGETNYLSSIIRNIGLTMIAIYLYRFPKGRFGLDK
jgi:uncharacterized membrane protein YphA (DoxX/SURF4 family)